VSRNPSAKRSPSRISVNPGGRIGRRLRWHHRAPSSLSRVGPRRARYISANFSHVICRLASFPVSCTLPCAIQQVAVALDCAESREVRLVTLHRAKGFLDHLDSRGRELR
jgi:hypothetical protein